MGYTKEDEQLMRQAALEGMSAPNTDLQFTKTIYAYKKKSQDEIFEALQTEVDYLLGNHKGYVVKKIEGPVKQTDGSLLYGIILKKQQQ